MRIPVIALSVVFMLGGCSTFRATEPPVCDGRNRRPANPYGSVLDPARAPVKTPAASESPQADGGCA